MNLRTLLLLTGFIFALPSFAQETLKKIAPPYTPPAFELTDIDGEIHKLSDYKGRITIVSFWASWCPPCRREMPSMERAWKQLKQYDVEFLAVNAGEDEETIFLFTADFDLNFPLLRDPDGSVTEAWPVQGLPTTYVLNQQGDIIYQAVGGREWDSPNIINLIKDLASKK